MGHIPISPAAAAKSSRLTCKAPRAATAKGGPADRRVRPFATVTASELAEKSPRAVLASPRRGDVAAQERGHGLEAAAHDFAPPVDHDPAPEVDEEASA